MFLFLNFDILNGIQFGNENDFAFQYLRHNFMTFTLFKQFSRAKHYIKCYGVFEGIGIKIT